MKNNRKTLAIMILVFLAGSGSFLYALEEAEVEDLMLMREEEKLARDVYSALFERWGLPVFSNIARSEQQHMDALAFLFETYGLTDPVMAERGQFSSSELQALHDDLLARGSLSLAEALKVGAAVEELDIKDLQKALERTEEADIVRVYQNLLRGSENHLRAFNRQLARF